MAALIVAWLAPLGVSRADLRPDELFIVYNRNVPESRDLAFHYAQRRGVPLEQMMGLDLLVNLRQETIAREEFESRIRGPLRAWLERQGLRQKVRCLVTVYGVPLRVGPAGKSRADRELLAEIEAELDRAAAQLAALADELAKQGPASQPAGSPATASVATRGEADAAALVARYEKARDQALARMQAVAASEQAAMQSVMALLQRGDGAEGLVGRLQSNDPASQARIDLMRAQVQQQRAVLAELVAACPRGDRREQAHAAVLQMFGLKGLVEHLEHDRRELSDPQTQASVDSELSLLWWLDHKLYRWLPNPMSFHIRHLEAFREAFQPEPVLPPVVMVARLDAPTPEIVRRMIDDAIAVEREGLAGTVYIDARGIRSQNGYLAYDADLRDLAALLDRRTDLKVVLDDRPELFGPGQCPDAALYAGWYQLGKYEDAFEWKRGAVAYHIASSEAVSLHRADAQYWCKRMLEEGVTATLGPVAEPYLHAFPLSRDFFGLLLTGEFTLVECYYRTISLNSWMMTLLGDPLYRPFGNRPLLKREDVFPPAWYDLPATQAARP